jgi:hypothetical protein
MPLLALAVFSFLLFIAMGVLALSAVVSEHRNDTHSHSKEKA